MLDNESYFKTDQFMQILNQYEEAVQQGNPIYMDADDLADIADYYQYNDRYEEAERTIDLALNIIRMPLVRCFTEPVRR